MEENGNLGMKGASSIHENSERNHANVEHSQSFARNIQNIPSESPCYDQIFQLAGKPNKISHALLSAAYRNDSECLGEILNYFSSSSSSFNHNMWSEKGSGRTAVWYASCQGSNQCLTILLNQIMKDYEKCSTPDSFYRQTVASRNDKKQNDSDTKYTAIVDLGSIHGTPPLLIATAMNHPETVSILISVGKTFPDITNPHGATASLLAAHYGHEEVLHVLLESGANPNKCDDRKLTPVMAASKNGHCNILKLLHRFGADFKSRDETGMDCVMMASLHDKGEVLDFLSSIVNSNTTAPDMNQLYLPVEETPLHLAVRHDNVESCKALLRSPCVNTFALNVELKNIYHIAIDARSTNVLRQALCNIDENRNHPCLSAMINEEEGEHGMSPLHYAISVDYAEAIHLLVPIANSNLCLLRAGKYYGMTPLQVAVMKNDLELVQTLLEVGISTQRVDVDFMNNDGHTALIIAASLGYLETCKLLVNIGGANVNIKTKKRGHTALQKAKRRKFDDVVDFLTAIGGI